MSNIYHIKCYSLVVTLWKNMAIKISQECRLRNIYETKIRFIEETNQDNRISKKRKKV